MIAKFKKNKKRKSWQNIAFSIFIGLGLLLVVVFLFYTNWKINQRRAELIDRISALKEEIAFLEQKNKELEQKKSQIESREYLEEVAREELGLKKPGEEVVVVQPESSFDENSEDKEERESWWEKIKSFWRRD